MTAADLEHYESQGYVRLGGILDPPALARLREEEARFRRLPQLSLSDGKTVLPDTATLFRNQVANYSAAVRKLFLDGPHLDAIEQLLGPLVVGTFTQFVTKLPNPDASGIFPWHQDGNYGAKADNGGDPYHVTVWVALDPTTTENGCIWVIPGSHLAGAQDHERLTDEWQSTTVKTDAEGVPVCLAAGEAVAFSGYTLHRSLPNRTATARRGFFMAYTSAMAHQPPSFQVQPLWLARGQLQYPAEPRQ